MVAGHGGGEYKDLVVFLAAAGIVVPLFSRLRISPVLGFLAAGVLLGPDGFGRFAPQIPWVSYLTITDRSQIEVLAELGVTFLLFMIGLELSWERLKAMRRLVFGFGLSQVLICSVVIGLGFLAVGLPLASAAVVGMALALSSTAVVMPVMAERKRLKGTVGRATFSVLLAQDLAVAPILITVTVLAAWQTNGASDGPALASGLLTLVPAAIGLGLIVLIGRLLLRPMFRQVARAEGRELFVAACLLVVVGTGVAAQAAGLSMGLGALVAGLLLAETEYRREVEVAIDPFKGLLLGVFFVGVGINLDLDAVAANPTAVLSLAAVITVVKIGLIFGLARAFKLSARAALEAAMVLGPAGEFAFVILTAGAAQGVVPRDVAQAVMLSATVSIFTIPLLALAADRLLRTGRIATESGVAGNEGYEPEGEPVLIVGFGRVGRLVGELLTTHGQRFLAIDTDPAAVAQGRKAGQRVYFGDAGQPEMLRRCGLEDARALVVTMDTPTKVDEVVRAARQVRDDDLILIARARDSRHAARLYALGVTDAVPETTEASLQLAENTLVDLGVPMGAVLVSIHERREVFRQMFQDAAPETRKGRPTRALRAGPGPGGSEG